MSYSTGGKSPKLIVLGDSSAGIDRSVLQAAGGFAWWYVDAVDEEGDGFVMIWSFGLPFLPGYLAAARSPAPQLAGQRPSLNVVLYQGGRPAFYLLQEYAPAECEWVGGSWRFGRSTITNQGDNGELHLRAEIDCQVPGTSSRLRGQVSLKGAVTRTPQLAAPSVDHVWIPLAGPSQVQAKLQHGSERFEFSGYGYHDCNAGHTPFDQLGIKRWTWGRLVNADGIRIYYAVWPESSATEPTAWGIELLRDGSIARHVELDVCSEASAVGRYGMHHDTDLVLRTSGGEWGRVVETAVVDDGPFYLRALVSIAHVDGAAGLGFSEWIEPSRIDVAWKRPFVKMRVHRTDGRNSFFLPLFVGPRSGRLRRLLRLP